MQKTKSKSNEHPVTPRQQKAISLLLSCKTREEVITELNLSSQTLYKWLKDPDFKGELARQQNEVTNKAINVLKSNMSKAADTLVSLLDENGGELRRRAANDIISHVLKARELEEIETRLEQVERVVLEKKTYRS